MKFLSDFAQRHRCMLPALALAAACAALTGCVVAPAYPAYDGGMAGEVYAPMAPPPLQTEVIPIAPSPVHVWIGGSWGWSSGRYAWRPGYWAVPPRPGYVWQPRRWDHGPRGWQSRGGRWGRR